MHRRAALLVAASAAVAGASFAPSAAARGYRRRPQIAHVETPLGVQGLSNGDGNIVLPFVVVDRREKPVDVEVQYGVDYNSDGELSEDEYRPATEARLDPRDTRSDEVPQLFSTDVGGSTHAYVWNSLSDVGGAHLLRLEYALTPQGRFAPDRDNPGSYLFATGPDGVTPLFAGVKVRMRTRFRRPGHRRAVYGAWVSTDAFDLDNRRAPSMTIDSVASGGPVIVHWTAFDPDSEDLNGNGVLDVADGEDMNGNGKLDCARVGVAFDFHIVWDGEDPASMTDEELEALPWIECVRVPGVGDTDSLLAQPGVVIPEIGSNAGVCSAPYPVGRHWTFAWDPVVQIGTTWRGFILRATPFDETRARGKTVYSRTIVYEQE